MSKAQLDELARIRVAIAAKRVEVLRDIPARYEYENPRAFLKAFCVANNLPDPFPETAEGRVAVLKQLPQMLGFKHLEDFISALSAAHGRAPGRRILTPEKIDRLIELSAQKVPTREIAKILGCAKQTVANTRCELGITRARKGEGGRLAPSEKLTR